MFFKSAYLNELSLDQVRKVAPAVFAQAPHERTSDRYLFIQTDLMLQGLIRNGWSVVSAVQQGNRGSKSLETNKHALMLARQDDLGKEFKVGGTMPLLKIQNSHDGLSSFEISTALFRKVCANGLTVPDGILMAPRVKHTKDMVNDVIEASYKVISEFPKLTQQVEFLQSVQLTAEERKVFSESAARLIFEQDKIDRTNKSLLNGWTVEKQLLVPKRQADRLEDLWTVTNVIQENAIRGNVKLVGETGKLSHAKEVKSLDRDKQINTELLMLAQKMAELKGVRLSA